MLPAQGRLADPAGAERHLHARVLPELDQFVSAPAFEEVCQEWLARATDAAATGWWWGRVRELRDAGLRDVDRELDAVAVDDDANVLAIGSCKWTQGAMQLVEKRKLDALAAHLAPDGGDPPSRYLFSRAGFTADLHAAAKADGRLHLVGLDQLGASP